MTKPENKTFTCVSCPVGCLLEVSFTESGDVDTVTGNTCNRGIEYAKQEAVDPKRNISAVVMVEGVLEPLSVKTAEPVSKDKIFDVMEEIRTLHLAAPITAGQTLIENAANTGVAIIATKTI